MMQLLKKMMRQTTLIHVDWTVMNLKISLHYSKVCKSKRVMQRRNLMCHRFCKNQAPSHVN